MDSWVVNTGSLNNFQNDLEVAVLHKHAWPLAAEEDLEQFVHYCLVEMLECYLVLMLTSGVFRSVNHNRFQYLRRSELGNLQGFPLFILKGKKPFCGMRWFHSHACRNVFLQELQYSNKDSEGCIIWPAR
jgi:hypothetical protein